MRIILNERQYESLETLIINDPDYLPFVKKLHEQWEIYTDYSGNIHTMISGSLSNYYAPELWPQFIKHKYNIKYRVSEDEYSEIYYGSLYGTKSRINMMLLRL